MPLTSRSNFPSRRSVRSTRLPARHLALLLPLLGGCFLLPPPASRSPLKEKLAPLSSSELEDATRTCLQKTGWKVDDLSTQHGDIRVLHAKRGSDDASLNLYSEGVTPRITGDLAGGADAFWHCLEPASGADKPGSDTPEADAGHD
jgi:hypothetical protein